MPQPNRMAVRRLITASKTLLLDAGASAPLFQTVGCRVPAHTAERADVTATPSEITQYGLGSVLSGGGSTPAENTPEAWADMVDSFQSAALDTRLGIPLLYGVDSVHGHGNLLGATVFPHNIGLGASRDPKLVEKIEHITAEETRATGPHVATHRPPAVQLLEQRPAGRPEEPGLRCGGPAAG